MVWNKYLSVYVARSSAALQCVGEGIRYTVEVGLVQFVKSKVQ